jgi:uncharacterized protein GlcG (DUF336 family)
MSHRHQRSNRQAIKRRRLRTEQLERRELLAGDVAMHNTESPTDVNGDGRISAIDALAVVNHMTRARLAEGDASAAVQVPKMVDVDNNGRVTARDALMVINDLRVEGLIAPANTPRPPDLDFSLFPKPADVDDDGIVDGVSLSDVNSTFDVLTNFKTLDAGNPNFEYASQFNKAFRRDGALNQLTTSNVDTLLSRASAATKSDDAIIVVVDRNGTMLGVRVEDGVSANLKADPKKLAFAIDGAAAKARTAAFFSSNAAPITSRTIRSLSQSTMVQRVVESSPVATTDEYFGPGFVAPIGVGGKFPPEINFTPQVDLFAIEHQSRDSQRHPGPDQVKGNTDDFYLRTRFNGNPTFIPDFSETFSQSWPEAYGLQTDQFFDSQSRGVATLPGGVPLFKFVTENGGGAVPANTPLSQRINLVGGIGVFFPGEDGYATFEQGFQHGVGQSEVARTNAPKVLEAEFAAVIAAAGRGLFNPFQHDFLRDLSYFNARLPKLENFALPTGRIDLVGITLEIFGPNPTRAFRKPGIDRLIQVGHQNFGGVGFISGELKPISSDPTELLAAGQPVPEGWLVAPHDSQVSGLTAEAVDQIVTQGVIEAQRTRAAIRLDIDGGFRPGAKTGMVLSVADTNGELLGVYRMPDATVFSIDVSIAKSRNTAYYADPIDLQPEDRLDFDNNGVFGNVTSSRTDYSGDTLPLGSALTNRTFRFVVEPRYPTGIELPAGAGANLVNDPNMNLCDQNIVICQLTGPQSILRLPGIDPNTGENLVNNQPLSASVYQFSPADGGKNSFSTLAFDAFNPSRNFRDPGDANVIINGSATIEPLANQNGIVFFPGSSPLYLDLNSNQLIGGFGVSGDGVDQDDVVTSAGQVGFDAPAQIRSDAYTLAGVRLPFQKFNRNPFGA